MKKFIVKECKCKKDRYQNDDWHFLKKDGKTMSFCSKCGAGSAPDGIKKKGYVRKILVDDDTFRRECRGEITDEQAYDEFKYADEQEYYEFT
jgi:hypothetical protein